MRRTRRPSIWVSSFVIFSLLYSAPAFAEGNPATKLGRGIANVLTGWVEIPKEFARYAPDKKTDYGPIFGFLEGLQQAGRRTFYGVWDVLTFPFPPYASPTPEPTTLLAPKEFSNPDDYFPEIQSNVSHR